MHTRLRPFHAAVLFSLTTACGLQAQATDSVGSPRETQRTCSDAAEGATQRGNDSVYRVSLRTLSSCGEVAGMTLAKAWKQPPSGPASLRTLTEVSTQVRDDRVFEAVSIVASDPSQPVDLRLGAMAVLVNYFDSHLYAEFPEPPQPAVHPAQYVRLGASAHDLSRPGARPLTTAVRPRIVNLFERLGSTDRNERVKNSAMFLAKHLRMKL